MTGKTGVGVSAVVPHYGDPAVTANLVEALGRQRVTYPLEIIVVDDAAPRPFPPLSGITVKRRSENGGFGAAVNTGAGLAREPFLMVLNNDLQIDPDFVERLVTVAARLQPAVVGPRVLNSHGMPVYSARHFPRTRHFVLEWLVALARFRDANLWHRGVGHDLRSATGATFEADWLLGAALLIPRGPFLAVGGFDTRFHMNSEEVDLQLRLRQTGVRAFFVGTVVCSHEGGSSSGSDRERIARVVQSRLVYAGKWGGRSARMRLQLALGCASVVNFLWRSVRRAAGRQIQPLADTVAELRMLRTPRLDADYRTTSSAIRRAGAFPGRSGAGVGTSPPQRASE